MSIAAGKKTKSARSKPVAQADLFGGESSSSSLKSPSNDVRRARFCKECGARVSSHRAETGKIIYFSPPFSDQIHDCNSKNATEILLENFRYEKLHMKMWKTFEVIYNTEKNGIQKVVLRNNREKLPISLCCPFIISVGSYIDVSLRTGLAHYHDDDLGHLFLLFSHRREKPPTHNLNVVIDFSGLDKIEGELSVHLTGPVQSMLIASREEISSAPKGGFELKLEKDQLFNLALMNEIVAVLRRSRGEILTRKTFLRFRQQKYIIGLEES